MILEWISQMNGFIQLNKAVDEQSLRTIEDKFGRLILKNHEETIKKLYKEVDNFEGIMLEFLSLLQSFREKIILARKIANDYLSRSS